MTGTILLVAALIGGLYLFRHAHKAVALTDKDTVVLADFTNTTGDQIFDHTLRQGLASQLSTRNGRSRKIPAMIVRMADSLGDRLVARIV